MLDLGSPRWAELSHAYGNAANIPPLLRALASLPDSDNKSEPWFSLWSSLAHQGDVYSASLAAVPHVIAAASSNPTKAEFSYFLFPAVVEIGRQKAGLNPPPDLATAYFSALNSIPPLVAAASQRDWDDNFTACALAAIAAAKGDIRVAEAILELTPEVAIDFMEWFRER